MRAGMMVFGLLAAVAVQAETAQLLLYRVVEQGAAPYLSRVLVTPEYVRLDAGDDTEGFSLLDRGEGVLYSIDHAERSVLVIAPPPAPAAVPGYNVNEQVSVDNEAPLILGVAPRRIVLRVNGETCHEAAVLPGVLVEAVAGLRDLRLLLARQTARVMASHLSPPISACAQALDVAEPLRLLRHGLPVEIRTPDRHESLLDFRADVEIDAALFRLPGGYHRIHLPGAG